MRGSIFAILTVIYMMGVNWALDPNTFDDNALPRERYVNLFLQWKENHNVEIPQHEEEYRLGVWADNHDIIGAHNQAGDTTYTLGHNAFSHLTHLEFQKRLGYRPQDRERDSASKKTPLFPDFMNQTAAWRKLDDLPFSLDWRRKGAVTSVKDQKQCGSCWSFSAIGAIEGAYTIKYNKSYNFSEQMIVDCDEMDQGCDGGDMVNAFEFVMEVGICTEEDYPYTATDGACQRNKCRPISGATVKSWVTVDQTEKALMEAVNVCPVSVSIEVTNSFQFYKSGIYHTPSCGEDLNHGVLLVGYDHSSESDYWIVKNSWGKSWGQKGYIFMKRSPTLEGGECGIERESSYPILVD